MAQLKDIVSESTPDLTREAEKHPAQSVPPVSPGLWKKLRGSFLVGLGYLLSPLCWWNDLIFNLPVAWGVGYLCGLISQNLFLPGTIAGYWLSNLVGILLMQFGAVDILQDQSKKHNFRKELLMGVATSTIYTLFILVLIQFKVLDIAAILPDQSLNLDSLWSFFQLGNR
jgi:hypothetical protein